MGTSFCVTVPATTGTGAAAAPVRPLGESFLPPAARPWFLIPHHTPRATKPPKKMTSNFPPHRDFPFASSLESGVGDLFDCCRRCSGLRLSSFPILQRGFNGCCQRRKRVASFKI